jgi:hypothetical protein
MATSEEKFEKKVTHLKYLTAKKKEIVAEITSIQNELASHGEPLRQLFFEKVQALVDVLKTFSDYEIEFTYDFLTYSIKTAQFKILIRTKNNLSSHSDFGYSFRWLCYFNRRTPTTKKQIDTKYKGLLKHLENFAKYEPSFKQQYDKKKLVEKLKQI